MFWLASIYILSIFFSQIICEDLSNKLQGKNLKNFPNVCEAIKTLKIVCFIPFVNTFVCVLIGFSYLKNEGKI